MLMKQAINKQVQIKPNQNFPHTLDTNGNTNTVPEHCDTISFNNNNNKKSNCDKKAFGLFLIFSGILDHSLSDSHQQGPWFNTWFMVHIKINSLLKFLPQYGWVCFMS